LARHWNREAIISWIPATKIERTRKMMVRPIRTSSITGIVGTFLSSIARNYSHIIAQQISIPNVKIRLL
jgi:hypothetical protein